MSRNKLKPKLITVIKEGYSLKKFLPDLTAGIIVGIVALPLAIAFAIASGVKPEQGLYTAVVGGVHCFLFERKPRSNWGAYGRFHCHRLRDCAKIRL